MSELRECPFCGAIPKLMHFNADYWVDCSCAQMFREKDECIKEWNTRHEPTQEWVSVENEIRELEPEYHKQGMNCGLEDRNINSRYDAMEYGFGEGFQQAIELVLNIISQPPTSDKGEG